MLFALRMAGREMRSSWKKLSFFFLCIGLGVASIVTLRSVVESVSKTLLTESKQLMASDVLIESYRPFTNHAAFVIREKLVRHGAFATTRSIETTTMVGVGSGNETNRMVELRSVEEEFPYYGDIKLTDGVYNHDLLKNGGALVRPELLTQLDINVGDQILIGKKMFTVRGVVIGEAGRNVAMFNMGPRVFIDYADFDETGILGFGGRVRQQILVQINDENIEELIWDLDGALAEDFVRVRSYRDAGNRVIRRLNQGESYLGLVGFVILILGGLGIWSVTRVFVAQKLKSIAILKCLGVSTVRVFAIYFLQVVFLSGIGSIFGVLLAFGALELIPNFLGSHSLEVEYGVTPMAVLQGVGMGLLVSAMFAISPLLRMRSVRPLLLLRPTSDSELVSFGTSSWLRLLWGLDRLQASVVGILLVVFLLICSWQVDSWRVGGYVFVTVLVVALFLHLGGVALVKLVTTLNKNKSFSLRHAILNLSRPGNYTQIILLAVGIGCCFVLTIRSLHIGLLDQFAVELQEDAPDMFFVDVQDDQVNAFASRAWKFGATHVNLVPVLRARVIKVKGRDIQLDSYEDVRRRGSLGREYTITYRNHIEVNEDVIRGEFWNESYSPDLEVSIESSLWKRYKMDVGDEITFDIMGRKLVALVTNVRDVDWSASRNGGFMFVFRPGALKGIPNTYAGFVKAPEDEVERVDFQREVIAGFQNISAIDLRDILHILEQLVGKISLAVSAVGSISLFSGGLILLGSIAMTKYQRCYETAVFRTLGARRSHILMMMFFEYATLGALAGLIGSLGAQALSFLLSEQVFGIPFRLAFDTNVIGIFFASAVVSIVGVVVTLDVVNQKPIGFLSVE